MFEEEEKVLEKIVSKYGPFVSNIFEKFRERIGRELLEISSAEDRKKFVHAFSIFLQNCYLRGVDVDVGDNLALKSTYHLTFSCIQGQLNRHHFGSKSLFQNDHVIPQLDDMFNIRNIKNFWRKNLCVVQHKYTKQYEFLPVSAEIVVNFLYPYLSKKNAKNQIEMKRSDYEIITILDFKNMKLGLCGLMFLLNGYILANVHDTISCNASLLVLNQATLSSQKVDPNETLFALTRNSIEKVQPPHSGIATIMYEDTVNKFQKMIKLNETTKKFDDNLEHFLSRTVVGMPQKQGMSFFDLIQKCSM